MRRANRDTEIEATNFTEAACTNAIASPIMGRTIWVEAGEGLYRFVEYQSGWLVETEQMVESRTSTQVSTFLLKVLPSPRDVTPRGNNMDGTPFMEYCNWVFYLGGIQEARRIMECYKGAGLEVDGEGSLILGEEQYEELKEYGAHLPGLYYFVLHNFGSQMFDRLLALLKSGDDDKISYFI